MNEWWRNSQLALRLAAFLSFKESSTIGLHLKPEKAFSGEGQSAQHLHHHVMHFRCILPRAKPCVMMNLSLSTSTSVFFSSFFCKNKKKSHFILRNSSSKLICRNLSACDQPLIWHRVSFTFHLLVRLMKGSRIILPSFLAATELYMRDCGFNHCMLSLFIKHCHIIIRQSACTHSDCRCVSLYSLAATVIDW